MNKNTAIEPIKRFDALKTLNKHSMDFYWVYDLPNALFGLMTVAFFVIIAVAGLFLLRGFISTRVIPQSHNDIVSFFMSVWKKYYSIKFHSINMDNVLDQPDFSTADIMEKLKKAGFERVYETLKNEIVVEEIPSVGVKIVNKDGKAFVKRRFPQIGSVPQIAATVICLVLTGFNILISLVLGQVASMVYYYPKINNLKERVEKCLI